MALTIVSPVSGLFDPQTRDQASLASKYARAVFGAGTAAQVQTARKELLRQPDFKARAKTTDNSAASEVIDLTTEGVTFPTGTVRKICFRSFAMTDNDQWLQDWEQYVLGGTTPKLLGSPRLINAVGNINGTAVQYGTCHAACNFDSSDTAITTTVGTSDVATSSTAGSSIGSIATNTATLTHPIARAGGKRVLGVNASADVATVTEILSATVFPINSTTMSIFTGDTATPSADGFDDDGRLEVEFYILPPPSIALVVTSNNVEVHCGHDATDDVYHNVSVYIGPAESVATVAD